MDFVQWMQHRGDPGHTLEPSCRLGTLPGRDGQGTRQEPARVDLGWAFLASLGTDFLQFSGAHSIQGKLLGMAFKAPHVHPFPNHLST